MTQIPGSRIAAQALRSSSRSLGFRGTVVLLLLSTFGLHAQTQPNNDAIRRNKPAIPAATPAPQQDVAPQPVVSLPPRARVEEPTRPPAVAWDGKQLTIDAENSTLADILVAVEKQTGASIVIPRTAWAERTFVHLGPGAPRDIISDLVYGLPFDYIIESAEDDPDTLRRIVLTPQGLDDSGDAVAAGGAGDGTGNGGGGSSLAADAYRSGASGGVSRPDGARMMRGWSSSGKTTFQAEAEAEVAAQQAAAEEPSATQDSAPSQDSGAVQASAVPELATVDDAGEITKASDSSNAASDSTGQSGVGQAIQSMTKMFEQRRQIQVQQNQPPAQSSN